MRALKHVGIGWALVLVTGWLQAQTTTKGAVLAAKPELSGKAFGVIIGISAYDELPKLKYADRDALAFYDFLRSYEQGVDTNNLFLFTNKNASKDLIVQKMYDITDNAKEGDKIYFFFSGHGDVEQLIQTDNTLLLLSQSPTKNYLRRSNAYLDINTLKTFFQVWATKKIKVFFICDACHSGSLVGGEEGKKNSVLGMQQAWQNEIKILSCQPDEVSLESNKWGGGRGLFSYYLILGLKGLSDKDKDKNVSLRELDAYLKDQVGENSLDKQIPVVYGDLKNIVSKTNDAMLQTAKVELSTNLTTLSTDLAARGNGNDNWLVDSVTFQLYNAFNQQRAQHNLLEPEGKSAIDLFKQLEKRSISKNLLEASRFALIDDLKIKFNELLTYFYEDKYDQFGLLEKYQVEKELKACLSIGGNNTLFLNQVKAALLFLNACELAIDIRPGSNDYFTKQKLQNGVDLLKKAVALDPLAPYLYLRLGDYYLYSDQLDLSIEAYTTYQKLLPNDEFSYNKLGLAYMYKKNKPMAIQAFRKAVSLNPNYVQAVTNLQIALR